MLILSLLGLLQNQNIEIMLFCTVVLCYPHNNVAGIHMCDECTRSNAPSVGHKILSILSPHEQVRLQTTKYQVYQYEPNLDTLTRCSEYPRATGCTGARCCKRACHRTRNQVQRRLGLCLNSLYSCSFLHSFRHRFWAAC